LYVTRLYNIGTEKAIPVPINIIKCYNPSIFRRWDLVNMVMKRRYYLTSIMLSSHIAGAL